MFRFRSLAVAAGLAAVAALAARADDAIAPETVEAVKRATVFIRVEGDGWGGSGSGFVVHADAKGVVVATNEHVAVPAPPFGARPSSRPVALTVVFDGGTKTERSYAGVVLAADADRDLALLRVDGVKDAPKPIAYADAPRPVETMAVYTFGFPFGKALATGKGSPAVTVGKASVSSLRNGDDGELSVVQIDGNLNPGNSGGPVVDGKGRLIGVAVATIREGRGIGLTVPAGYVARMVDGSVGWVRVNAHKKPDGTAAVRVFAELIDPKGNLRAPAAHYVVVGPREKRPDAAALDRHPGSRKVELKAEGGVASAEFAVPAAEGEVLVQVTAGRAEKVAVATPVRAFPLAPPPKVVDLANPPPLGWKEYAPPNRGFAMWIPTRTLSLGDEERTVTVADERVAVTAVDGRTANGLAFEGEVAVLPPALAARSGKEVFELFRVHATAGLKGRVAEARVVEMGTLTGEEYTIQVGPLTTRVRLFVSGPRVYTVRVAGTADQLARKEADILLAAFRPPGPNTGTPVKPPPVVVVPPKGKEVVATPKGKDPVVIGGNSPPFKDVAPEKGFLVGLELGLGKFGSEDVIKAVRPVYRVGDKESFGTQRGTSLTRVVTLKAKDGYAVAAITHKSGLNFDGCSLTYMKVVDGKLDPKDSYESDWVGYVGRKTPGKIGGDGTRVVGIVGRAGGTDLNGLGLLFEGQEEFDPNPPLPIGKEPTVLGGYTNTAFKDAAPEGGLLVGFEFSLVKPFGRDVIRGVRPVFRAGEKETTGESHGTEAKNAVVVKAKAGYAVGRVTVRHFGAFEGCSVTFMKVADGKLDPKDSYESDWVGSDEGNKTLTKLGDGTPVIGVVGRVNEREMVAMGLLFQGQEAFTPKK